MNVSIFKGPIYNSYRIVAGDFIATEKTYFLSVEDIGYIYKIDYYHNTTIFQPIKLGKPFTTFGSEYRLPIILEFNEKSPEITVKRFNQLLVLK
jgi:hypothetical protein